MKKLVSFFKIYIKKPREVSAWFPTSKKVAQKVAGHVPPTSENIVEYGPGLGAVAQAILSRVGPKAKFTAIEILPDFVNQLKKIKDSRLEIIEGDIIQVSKNFKKESIDVILSSIPLSRTSKEDREKLIQISHQALKPGGRLIIYYQNSRLIMPVLKNIFREVKWSFTPLNFTPYFIIVAQK